MDIVKTHLKQSGFTLLELMVSITLGVLVMAATLQIMFTSQSSLSSQEAGSNIQADAIFGLGTLKKSIRAINYDAFRGVRSEFVMNKQTPGGGLVMTVASSATDRPTSNVLVIPPDAAKNKFLISGKPTDTNMGLTNLQPATGTLKSDQLVLQYKVTGSGNFDCEGNSVTDGFYVVERYFLRTDSIASAGEPTALALACSAVSYGIDDTGNTPAIKAVGNKKSELKKTFTFQDPTKIGGNGTILINRVDHFHFLLGVESGSDVTNTPTNTSVRYMSVSDYGTSTAPIVAVRIGLVVRSGSTTQSGQDSADQRFTVLDQNALQLKTDVASQGKYQRQVLESNIIIRNGRG